MSDKRRDPLLFINDIIECSKKIILLTENTQYEEFVEDWVKHDAILRNLEIIGEASKNIPDELKKQYHEIEWRELAGLRDILTHKYFGIDDQVIWNTIIHDIPELLKKILN